MKMYNTIDQCEFDNFLKLDLPTRFQGVEDKLHGTWKIGEIVALGTVDISDLTCANNLDERVFTTNRTASQAAAPRIIMPQGYALPMLLSLRSPGLSALVVCLSTAPRQRVTFITCDIQAQFRT